MYNYKKQVPEKRCETCKFGRCFCSWDEWLCECTNQDRRLVKTGKRERLYGLCRGVSYIDEMLVDDDGICDLYETNS